MDLNLLRKELLSGKRRALSQAITLTESQRSEDRTAAAELLESFSAIPGKSQRIGITGIPGAGKSSFIEGLGSFLLAQGYKVAVLPIDPSSPISGGSLLGDKIRMQDLSQHTHAYVRPAATGSTHGGISPGTRESIRLCEVAGYEIIFVESVGQGQQEGHITQLVDLCLLLLITGAGDEWQTMKKGVLETADLSIIHKADGKNKEQAQKTATQYKQHSQSPVISFSSLNPQQNKWKKLWEDIQVLFQQKDISQHRTQQHRYWLQQYLEKTCLEQLYLDPEIQNLFQKAPAQSPHDPLYQARSLITAYYKRITQK
ncbi:MAG: methylmalonyl Co-A mutase-associated GTPase MeaB [Cytophagales bacterium]|nr:methylmalonyl Co-A mutase-associated GTPase MeaB [Cytophagales bacterium]